MGPLVLAAFGPEVAPLAIRGSRLQRVVVGVGLVESAIGAAHAIATHRPEGVILVGTAGAFASAHLAIGEVVVSTRLVLSSAAVARDLGAMAPGMISSLDADASLYSSFAAAGVKRVTVATTLAITTDDALARDVATTSGAHVEHLEAFAVARACAKADVPFCAVLGIANVVGSRGRSEWRAHHKRASSAACEVVSRVIEGEATKVKSPTTRRSRA
jgi:nucleoside phosphorylase